MRRRLGAVVVLGVAALALSAAGWGQSLTTGALSGVVTDPSGAAIPAAKVTATNAATGVAHSTESQVNGSYLIPLLEPGQYTITVEKTGFQTAKQSGVGISVSATNALNFKLVVGATTQTVEVTGLPPLIQPQNANTTTTLDSKAIENLPNPGGDITMLAQIAPGASMMVHGGGGTAGLAFNGVQGNAVNYTFDGMDDNDPFNNDNNSGPSNMLLGQNSVAEMTVNTNSYSVDQGRMSAAQINYLSKSGSNNWHGNAQWQWNGRALNAYDYFVKAQPLAAGQNIVAKPFDNVNNWAASVGGPIVKNKLFFFVDSEGTRIDLPHVANFTAPSQAEESYAAQQLLVGGFDTDITVGNGSTYRDLPAQPGEAAWQSQIFKLYGDTSIGTHGNVQINQNTNPSFGCNLVGDGSVAGTTVDGSYMPQVMPTGVSGSKNPGTNPIPQDTGCLVNGILTTSAKTPETLTSFRVDYTLNQNNTLWGKYSDDQGTQTTGISAINPVFNENSFQPDHQGVLDWTHVFTPTLTNDASAGFLWYSAIFDFNTPTAEHAAIDGLGSVGMPTTGVGSTNFPQGRNVTQYQAIDNLTWTRGTHSFKFGENFRRELVNDHDFARAFASSNASDWQQLMYGAATSASQRFPIAQLQQFKDFSLDLYASDTWQLEPTLTLTYGLRATHNSNPVDRQPFEAQFADWATFGNSTVNGNTLGTAPNSIFTPTDRLWTSVPFQIWQPRISLAWQPMPNTLVRAGWGMFGQVASTSSAETLANNPPFNPSWTAGFGSGNLGSIGQAGGCTIDPVTGASGPSTGLCGYLWAPGAGSAVAAAGLFNSQFQSNFTGGNLSCTPGATPTATCVPSASISALPASGLKAPMVYNYSLTVQEQLGRSASVNVGYVGTRSQHNSFTMADNAYQTVCNGCFAPFLFSSAGNAGAPDPRFNGYSQTRYDGYGRYDSMQAGYVERLFHGLTFNLNYTWSHCLTSGTPYFDGAGIAGSLGNTYATCSDDIAHVANASYTYALPFHSSASLLGKIVNDWQISGSTFAQGGQPVFIGTSGGSSLNSRLQQSGGPIHGYLLAGASPYAIGQWLGVTPSGKFTITQPDSLQWFNPMAFAGIWDSVTKSCYNPVLGTEGKDSAHCQFNGNNTMYFRGPTFQWTNLDVSKSFQLTERASLRIDFQGYNVFNHPNFSNPSITAPAPLSPTTLAGVGAITSMASPNNGLLGDGNGGDSAPRMVAFQAKITF